MAIERLLQSDHDVRSVLVSLPKYERMAPLLDGLAAARVRRCDRRAARRPSASTSIVERSRRPIGGRCRRSRTLLRTARRIAVLEGLNDPENLGAIARSARAFGIDALVLDPTCIDPYYRRTVRVSMGEILFLPVARATNWKAGLATIREAGFEHVGADSATRRDRSLDAARPGPPGAAARRRRARPEPGGAATRRRPRSGSRSPPTSTRSTWRPRPPSPSPQSRANRGPVRYVLLDREHETPIPRRCRGHLAPPRCVR